MAIKKIKVDLGKTTRLHRRSGNFTVFSDKEYKPDKKDSDLLIKLVRRFLSNDCGVSQATVETRIITIWYDNTVACAGYIKDRLREVLVTTGKPIY